MIKFLLINAFFYGIYSFQIVGQCMQLPVSLEDRINKSLAVIEGKVISQQGFWDLDTKNIYTVHDVQILRTFNGVALPSLIKIVTRGGIVGLERETVTDAIEIPVGATGTFFLEPFDVPMPITGILYRSVAAADGIIRYNEITNTASSVFETYASITEDLYPAIAGITGIPISGLKKSSQKKENAVIAIQGFEPQTINAGTSNRLTIQGFGFGDNPGTVRFADANNGGRSTIASLPSQIISWNETTIVVVVPSRAGTGRIAVVSDDKQQTSSQNLEVFYNHLNVTFDDGSGNAAYETQLVNDNLFGGYTFQYYTDFAANSEAAAIFDRLTNTWSCGTGFNTSIGATTTVDEDAADGINIVRFDNGDELSGNTLAYARSRYRGCLQIGTVNWYIQEIEVVINDDYNWYYGNGIPQRNQIDFETVMLHEIGHAQQLGHVIAPNEVMHFSVNFGQQKRVLNATDIAGGNYVMEKSTSEVVCAQVPMTEASGEECSTLAIPNDFETAQVTVYPNPVHDQLIIRKAFTGEIQKTVIVDMNGKLVMIADRSFENDLQEIDLSILRPGMYLVMFITKTGNKTVSVLKM